MEGYIEILDKKTTVNENKIIVTKTVKEKLTYEQLLWKKEDCQRRKQRLIQQSQHLQKEFNNIKDEEQEIDNMIALLQSEDNEFLTLE